MNELKSHMFKELEEINARPSPFQFYTAEELWTDDFTSKKMLELHLNDSIDAASRSREFIDRSVEWIVSHFKVGAKTTIADFGCGPGFYTSRLAERNAEVLGIDFSKRSIQYAQETAAKKELHVDHIWQNYLDFETEKRFDLIIMIMCDYCALSPSQRKTMLCKYHTLLNPGGSLFMDVYSLNAFEEREETALYQINLLDGFWSAQNYYGFLNTFKYEDEKLVLDKYTIIEKERTRVVYNWLQYFSPDTLAQEFEANQFQITNLYSDVVGTPFNPKSAELAIVAKKL
jgi:2-polyprenyl-3-methyl-5-hydroxy-6-metoxy-1,4-benzoquinol methylase